MHAELRLADIMEGTDDRDQRRAGEVCECEEISDARAVLFNFGERGHLGRMPPS